MVGASFTIALAILLGLVPFVADIAAGGDVWKMQRSEEVSHTWGARLRALVLGLPCLTLLLPKLEIAHATPFFSVAAVIALMLLKTVILWLVLLTEFWLVFDLRVNKRWGKAWDYIGGTASLDTTWGKRLARYKYPGRVYVVFKILLLVSLLIIFLSI